MSDYAISDWLPMSRKEAAVRGWDELDVILVTGDAYVDHPAFGAAVVGRLIERHGFRVGIISQPNWRDDLRDFKKLGRPRLFFGVTAGNMDSMVNHYTAGKRLRSNDAYTAGGDSGFRPDYASVVYSLTLKKLFPDVPVVLGGIEASMRRLAHYDYWRDELVPSILAQSGADLLIYGMGEQPMRELLRLLERGIPMENLKTIPQTAYLDDAGQPVVAKKNWSTIEVNSFETCLADKRAFAEAFAQIERESNRTNASQIIQQTGAQLVVVNPPYSTMSTKELDQVYDLPYTRLPHPRYKKRGPISAFEMIKYSVNIHRGCFGGCSFCAIAAHQGKFISSRSKRSILEELQRVTETEGFAGHISDLGGPTANMYQMSGRDKNKCDRCSRASCVYPKRCENLVTDHGPVLELYREAREMVGIKKITIGSGIRYDLFPDHHTDADPLSHRAYFQDLVQHHVSGRLKVAPEHTSDRVLKLMRKPPFSLFKSFKKEFDQLSKQFGLNLQLIPYFISSHPGCELAEMADLAKETKALGYRLEQIQDFMPTPMTLSAVMFYTGLAPNDLKPVFSAQTKDEKESQRKFFFWYKKENHSWIKRQLEKLGKPHLLG